MLNGNSKHLFNKRLTLKQVHALANALQSSRYITGAPISTPRPRITTAEESPPSNALPASTLITRASNSPLSGCPLCRAALVL